MYLKSHPRGLYTETGMSQSSALYLTTETRSFARLRMLREGHGGKLAEIKRVGDAVSQRERRAGSYDTGYYVSMSDNYP